MDIDKLTEEIKRIESKDGKEITDEEARKGAHNMVGLVELLFEIWRKDKVKKDRLKKEPDGFPVEGQYSCLICRGGIDGTTGWYDWYGQKCLLCQRAIKEGIIPAFICKNDNSYFSLSDLKYTFKLKHQAIMKYIREEKLKPRIILNNEGKPHEYIFLKKENPGLIERYSPERKSHDRNRDKVSKARTKEMVEEYREENRKRRQKLSSRKI